MVPFPGFLEYFLPSGGQTGLLFVCPRVGCLSCIFVSSARLETALVRFPIGVEFFAFSYEMGRRGVRGSSHHHYHHHHLLLIIIVFVIRPHQSGCSPAGSVRALCYRNAPRNRPPMAPSGSACSSAAKPWSDEADTQNQRRGLASGIILYDDNATV